jgi:hypothetical protein
MCRGQAVLDGASMLKPAKEDHRTRVTQAAAFRGNRAAFPDLSTQEAEKMDAQLLAEVPERRHTHAWSDQLPVIAGDREFGWPRGSGSGSPRMAKTVEQAKSLDEALSRMLLCGQRCFHQGASAIRRCV